MASKPASNSPPLTAEVVGFSLLIAVGLGFAHLFDLRGAFDYWKTRHWLATPAEISTSHLQRVVERRSTSGGSRTSYRYRLYAAYTYDVDGQTYRSHWLHHQVSFTPVSTQSGGETLLQRYFQPGTAATVYVNPADPQQAYLLRGPLPGQATRYRGLGYGIAGLGGLALAQTLRQGRPRTP